MVIRNFFFLKLFIIVLSINSIVFLIFSMIKNWKLLYGANCHLWASFINTKMLNIVGNCVLICTSKNSFTRKTKKYTMRLNEMLEFLHMSTQLVCWQVCCIVGEFCVLLNFYCVLFFALLKFLTIYVIEYVQITIYMCKKLAHCIIFIFVNQYCKWIVNAHYASLLSLWYKLYFKIWKIDCNANDNLLRL